MAIRVIEVPSSVRFDPPPHHFHPNDPTRADDSMKKPGGPGVTEEELSEYARTGKWPERADDASGAPSLGEAIVALQSLAARSKPGARGKTAEDIALVLKLLNEANGAVEEARRRFIVERTGKNLTPDERSVLSKRFTRAMKEIHKFGSTNQHSC
jgi:hypothetical protein